MSFDISIIDDLSSDEDDRPIRISDKFESQADNDQNSNSINEPVQLPKESKVWFLVSYSSFLIFFLVFVLALAFTYPLKPVCDVKDFVLPDNITEHMNTPVSIWLKFTNRNPLISYNYGIISLNVSAYYFRKSGNLTIIKFATTTAQAFSQPQRNHKERKVDMPVTAPRDSLLQMYNETRTVFLRVNLFFSVSFKCSVSCSHKELPMTPSVWYQYEIQNRSLVIK
ncbi:hypothetical protein Hanom_Chr10g00894561 [Helianthus anomalus]